MDPRFQTGNRRGVLALTLLALTIVASPAGAITVAGFEQAVPVDPQKIELGGQVAITDDITTAAAMGRIGLLPDADLALRLGYVSFAGALEDQSGFEVETTFRFHFLRRADVANIVDLAALGSTSFLKTDDLFVFGLDPSVVASRGFEFAPGRMLTLAGGVGLAYTHTDVEPVSTSDDEFGLLVSLSMAVDVLENVQFAVEGRSRDEFQRAAIAVNWHN